MYFIIHNSFGFGQSSNEKIAHRYFNLFQDYEYTEPDLAKKYADSGLIAAKNTQNEELIGRAYQFLGWIMQDQSRFKEANSYLKESLIHFKKSGNKQGIADAYGNYGNSFLDLEEYQLSLDYQQKSLKVNIELLKPQHFNGVVNFSDPQKQALHMYYRQFGKKCQSWKNDARGKNRICGRWKDYQKRAFGVTPIY